jgi:hypothetical protein
VGGGSVPTAIGPAGLRSETTRPRIERLSGGCDVVSQVTIACFESTFMTQSSS